MFYTSQNSHQSPRLAPNRWILGAAAQIVKPGKPGRQAAPPLCETSSRSLNPAKKCAKIRAENTVMEGDL